MADNVAITAGSGTTMAADELVDGTLGTVKVGFGKIMDGTLDGTNKLKITSNLGALVEDVPDVAPATVNITTVDAGTTSTVSANGQALVTGSPTANSFATFTLTTIESIRLQVTGTWTGTLQTEVSIDGGTTYFALGLHQGAYTTSSFTGNFVGGGNTAGVTHFRVRATAAVTGTAVIKVVESANPQSVYVANAAPSGNIKSLLNSTSATLTSGSVFTGTAEDVSNFAEIRITVTPNVASATDGLSIQQSPDATNWDVVDTYTVAAASAGQGKTFTVPRQLQYFRVVYTNGGTNQASFRLQTIFDRMPTAPSSNRASDGYTNETDLVQGQSFLMGYNGTTWDRIRTVGTGVVSTSAVLTVGSAIIGKVGIDQTTPGTTNAVAVTNLPTTADTNSGNKSASTLRTVLATDQPALSTAGVFSVKVDQTTPGTTNLVALAANQTVVDTPTTTGGLSKFHLVGAASDNATNVKASAGQVYAITAFNLNAAPRYLKFHNTAGTPTAGSGVTDTYLIPGNTTGAGLVINIDKGVAFGTGIGITIVTGIADASTTAISASEVVINVYYK